MDDIEPIDDEDDDPDKEEMQRRWDAAHAEFEHVLVKIRAMERQLEVIRRLVLEDIEEDSCREVRAAQTLAIETLLTAGYRRHTRGEWRMTRRTPEDLAVQMANPLYWPIPTEDMVVDRVINMVLTWVFAGKADPLLRERFRNDVDRVAAKLAGPNASGIEVVLAGVAATCWFTYRMLELHPKQHDGSRLDRAHKRFVLSLRALASVRRIKPSKLIELSANLKLCTEEIEE